MSKDIIVLTPNGRRQKVHCTPDTIMLQVLEDVCQKQGFEATSYDLKHHNQVLDLTSTIRFSNLPNKATLEMVETERKREETIVTIGLLLEDGERRTADFSPNTSLFDILTTLAPSEFKSLPQPTILYMRQEVVGESALKQKTLRQLGLMGGRAILRLLNKAEEARQANVSSVYRKAVSEKEKILQKPILSDNNQQPTLSAEDITNAGPSQIRKDEKSFDPITALKNEISNKKSEPKNVNKEENMEVDQVIDISTMDNTPSENKEPLKTSSELSLDTQERLERRLNIEEEVTFLGAQKAIAFMQPDDTQEELDDLPDDFYELTIDEVRKLYHDLQENRLKLENTPLVTSSKKQEIEKQTSQQKLNLYKNAVVRIQFPDRIILQGVFSPTDTVQDVVNFIKSHLQYPEKPFHVFTTPLKEMLDPKMTLKDAKFVPCVHMHFKWLEDENPEVYLKEEVYANKTTSDAASILASKYRAPSRRKMENDHDTSNSGVRSSSSAPTDSKVPKWFKK